MGKIEVMAFRCVLRRQVRLFLFDPSDTKIIRFHRYKFKVIMHMPPMGLVSFNITAMIYLSVSWIGLLIAASLISQVVSWSCMTPLRSRLACIYHQRRRQRKSFELQFSTGSSRKLGRKCMDGLRRSRTSWGSWWEKHRSPNHLLWTSEQMQLSWNTCTSRMILARCKETPPSWQRSHVGDPTWRRVPPFFRILPKLKSSLT